MIYEKYVYFTFYKENLIQYISLYALKYVNEILHKIKTCTVTPNFKIMLL